MKFKNKKEYIFQFYINIFLFSFMYLLSFGKANVKQIEIYNNIRKNSESDDDYSINNENLNSYIVFGGEKNKYITNTVDEDGRLFLESSSFYEVKERYVIGLYNNGRYFFEDSIVKEYTLEEKIKRKTGNSIIIKKNNNYYLLSISYDDGYLESLDLTSTDSPNNLYIKSQVAASSIINSNINSLFKKKDNYLFFLTFMKIVIYSLLINII